MKIIRLHPTWDNNPLYVNPEYITTFKATDLADGSLGCEVCIQEGRTLVVHETVKQILEMLHMDWMEDNGDE